MRQLLELPGHESLDLHRLRTRQDIVEQCGEPVYVLPRPFHTCSNCYLLTPAFLSTAVTILHVNEERVGGAGFAQFTFKENELAGLSPLYRR